MEPDKLKKTHFKLRSNTTLCASRIISAASDATPKTLLWIMFNKLRGQIRGVAQTV
jgi:hypothetical protein